MIYGLEKSNYPFSMDLNKQKNNKKSRHCDENGICQKRWCKLKTPVYNKNSTNPLHKD